MRRTALNPITEAAQMILKIFSIYDEKAHAYLPPFFLPTDGMALRTFSDCINSDTHQFGQHPSDYTIFHLGHFDDSNGELILGESSKSLGNGVEFIELPEIEQANGTQIDPAPINDEPPIQPGPQGHNSA